MKQIKRRLTAILLALFQLVSLASPASFAAAEGENIVSGTVNATDGMFYVFVDGSDQDLSALGENDYIVIKRVSSGGNEYYACIPFTDINRAGYYGVSASDFVNDYNTTVNADPYASYSIAVAHIEPEGSKPNYDEMSNAVFVSSYFIRSGGSKFNWETVAAKGRGGTSLRVTRETDTFDVEISFQKTDGTNSSAPAVDGYYYLIALDVGDELPCRLRDEDWVPCDPSV